MTNERVLALDVGTVRIGMALSDPTGKIAQPLETYTRVSRNRDIAYIGDVVRNTGAALVVSGLPKLLDGTEGEQAQKTRAFVERGARIWGVPVEYWDERLSTAAARSVLLLGGVSRERRKDSIDKLAATVILQNFLDARANAAQKGEAKKQYLWDKKGSKIMEDMDREIVELVDDEGNEVNLELLLTFEHKDNVYIAFCDADEPEDSEETEVRIMRVESGETEDDDEYVDIEDEAELDEVFQVFLDIVEQEG